MLLCFLVARMMGGGQKPEEMSLAQLLTRGEQGKLFKLDDQKKPIVAEDGTLLLEPNRYIKKVVDRQGILRGEYLDDTGAAKTFEVEYNHYGGQARDILAWTRDCGITDYQVEHPNEFLSSFLPQILVMVVLLGVLWVFLARQFQSGSNKAMSFGKSRAKLVTEGQVTVSFDDVAGIEEVKEELQEIISFLKNPDKYSTLGGRIPKGALLHGPPGTGKTLIARATAGEADVPFFSISGSDFVEMFVGVGASRVRDLFEQGKQQKPCIIYIDEIDAVGRHRFSGMGGGHDEREQTLNALLVELDGFSPNEGVIVMASTNRPDVLDPALLRPGRFDRQIRVDLPDVRGREKILDVHAKDKKLSDKVSMKDIAKGTPGFSGADLANLANEAALLAARLNKESIEQEDLEEAKDRVMMGPERRSLVMSDKERAATAYHEVGHALVGKLADDNNQKVHKVTIMPRGRTLGTTAYLPQEERHSENSQQLRNFLLQLLGGLVAEEVKFNDTTTGVGNDLQRATELAHRMVCEFGMSKMLGPRTFGSGSTPVFVGHDVGRERDYSENTASMIDAEVKKLIDGAYTDAKKLIESHMDEFERISQALIERETLTGDEIDLLLEGKELPPLFKENGASKKDEKETGDSDADEKSEADSSEEPPPIPEITSAEDEDSPGDHNPNKTDTQTEKP